jgi:hypothetical protein
MAKIVCIKCGLEGDSKCPHCRSIFVEKCGNPIGVKDTVASYRLKIDDAGIMVKRGRTIEGGRETNEEILEMLRWLLEDPKDFKVLGCVHEWEFAPFFHSEIDCGHQSPEGSDPVEFILRAVDHVIAADPQNSLSATRILFGAADSIEE